MSYTNHIQYTIYKSKYKESFSQTICNLLAQISSERKIFRLIFFGVCTHRSEYIEKRESIKKEVAKYFKQNLPAISFVAQAVCDSDIVMEVHSYLPEACDKIEYKTFRDLSYVTLENNDFRMLFAGGLQEETISTTIEEQSIIVFKLINNLLRVEKFKINEIVRQWNYIEQITYSEVGNQHYQLFNNARSSFYDQTTWNNGYPAATGIGTTSGGILIDLDAITIKSENISSLAIDNKLQIAAHSYSDNVLIQANDMKATPKFERARVLNLKNQKVFYISGTAAIRGEESLVKVGLEEQLRVTMENIHEILSGAKITLLRVYLKNSSDYKLAATILDSYKLNIPVSYLHADVCRDELLIEIEGIAKL